VGAKLPGIKKNMTNEWLPGDYVKPAGNSRYLKLQQGDNKIRILSKPITGWIDWETKQDGGKTPVRSKEKQPAINPAQPPKHFWCFVVWDYQEKNIKIMEITQATIQDAIFALHSSEDWGSPTEYDITIKKTGEKMETKYFVSPTPPRPLSQEVKEAYECETINLEALFLNGDPFEAPRTEEQVRKERAEIDSIPDMPF